MIMNLGSLAVYLTSLALTLIFLYIADAQGLDGSDKKMVRLNGTDIEIEKRFFLYALAFIPFWMIISLRDKSVGLDTHGTYFRVYSLLQHGDYANNKYILNFETGYLLLNRICIWLGSSYQIVLLVTATLTWISFYVYIVKYSKNCQISILVLFFGFYYFHAFNVIRQYLAMAIVIHGMRFIYERKFVKYIIVILLAMSFHKSVMLLIPLYFIYKVRINTTRAIISIVCSSLFLRVGRGMLTFLLDGSKYGKILFAKAAYSSGFAWSDFICNSVLLICGLAVIAISKTSDEKFDFNIWLQVIAVIIAVNSTLLPIPFRLLWYANINTMLYIPQLLEKIDIGMNRAIIKIGITVMYGGYFMYFWLTGVDGIQQYSFGVL